MDDMNPLDEVIMINEHVPNNKVPAEQMDDMYPLDEVIMINEHAQKRSDDKISHKRLFSSGISCSYLASKQLYEYISLIF